MLEARVLATLTEVKISLCPQGVRIQGQEDAYISTEG